MKAMLLGLAFAVGIASHVLAASTDGKWTGQAAAPDCGLRNQPATVILYLTVAQGQVSGQIGSTAFQTLNAALKPDGSFAGTTSGGNALAKPFTVSGQFSGNSASVTLAREACGTLTVQLTRAPG
jgi:hypothetical protein